MNLVYIDKYNLLGSNYYWHKHADYDITKEEIIAAGLTDERVRVDKSLTQPLQQIDQALQQHGFRLYIKEGYRPDKVYELVFQRRSEKFGEYDTRRLVNIEQRPHATGKTVDVTLWDIVSDKEMLLRDRKDGIEGLFINFYKEKLDSNSQQLQQLQDLVMETMIAYDFTTGPKQEYFHFNYIK